jgi:hypothetical protein
MGWHLTRVTFALPLAVMVVSVGAAGSARAQDQAAIQKMVELNKKALSAFDGGDLEMAKSTLLEAVVAGKEAGLSNHNLMARTYIHLGALYVEGFKDRTRGQRYLVNALKIRPDIGITPSLVTPALTEVFEAARRDAGSGGGGGGAAAPPPASAPSPGPQPGDQLRAPPAASHSPPARTPVPPPPRELAAAPPPRAAPAAPPGEEPDLPATISQPLQCPLPDEAPPEEKIFLRCVPRGDAGISRVLLFYRTPGDEKFVAVPMTKSSRGWFNGSIPANAVMGKSLQYYFEGRDSSDKVVGSAGRGDSPNLVMIREGAAEVTPSSVATGRAGRRRSYDPAGDEENPLEAIAREREEARAREDLHRRGKGAFFVGFGIGSGYGYHGGGKLEHRSNLRVAAGVSAAGLFHLAPELGYMFHDDFSISLQGRHQIILKQGTRDQPGEGSPARGATAFLAKLTYYLGGGNVQGFIQGMAGGGEGVRLVVPPRPTPSDPNTDLPQNDSIRGGPFLAGAGGGLIIHFSRHFAYLLELRGLAGFSSFAAIADAGMGIQVSF